MRHMKRIGPKMLISLLTTFFVVLGTFLILTIVQTTSLADSMAEDLTKSTAENYANQMSSMFDKADNLVLGLRLAAERYESIHMDSRRVYLDNMLEKAVSDEMTGILAAWACFEPNQLDNMDKKYANAMNNDETGRFISYFYNIGEGTKRDVLADYDVPGAGDYYLIAFETEKPYVTPPYDYKVGNETISIISVAYPVANRVGKTVGVIGVDYTMDYINSINDGVKLYENGYGRLFTDQGIMIAHIDKELINTVDQDYMESAESEAIKASLLAGNTYVNKSFSNVLNADAHKAFTNVPLGNSGGVWIYATEVPEAEVMESTNRMIMMISIIGGIGLAAAAVIIVILSGNISRPIKAMCKTANKIADGDLTVSVPNKFRRRKDEIGDLSNDIQRMQDSLSATVRGINNASNSLLDQVSLSKDTIDVLNDRLIATSSATEELSASMDDSGTSAENMKATVSEIELAVGVVSGKSEEGAGRSAEIHVRAQELDKNVNASIEQSNQMFREIKISLEKALHDSKAVDEINALAAAILSITSQTNLLALNASIEAARAGAAGKGFAVVANEISSLADNSKNTVTQIQAITKIVMNAVNALASSSTNLLNFVADNVQNDYQDMLKAADSYKNDAIYIADMTSDLNATSEELLASIHTLLKAIGEVSTTAQEGAYATAIVAEQTADISNNASTVAENMNKTQQTADELTGLISRFKLFA